MRTPDPGAEDPRPPLAKAARKAPAAKGAPARRDAGEAIGAAAPLEGTRGALGVPSGGEPDPWGLSPGPAPPIAAKKTPKPKVSKATPHGLEWAALIERYHAGYERVRGVRPTFDGADARAMQKLLEKVSTAEAKDYARAGRIVDNALADPWWGPKVTIRDIASNPARFDRTTPARRVGSHMQKAARDADGSLKKPELVDLDD